MLASSQQVCPKLVRWSAAQLLLLLVHLTNLHTMVPASDRRSATAGIKAAARRVLANSIKADQCPQVRVGFQSACCQQRELLHGDCLLKCWQPGKQALLLPQEMLRIAHVAEQAAVRTGCVFSLPNEVDNVIV